MRDDFNDGMERHGSRLPGFYDGGGDSRLPPQQRIVAPPLPRASEITLHNHTDSTAALTPRDGQQVATPSAHNNRTVERPEEVCGACLGTGQHAHFMGLCSYCGGTGLQRSDRERRQQIEDTIADALYDHEQGVASHRRQAEAVLAALLGLGLDVWALGGVS
jgi:hypothetical protein